MMPLRPWYILRVMLGQTLKVADAVRALGIETFCPAETIKRRHPFDRRMVIDVTRPLLPGYVFCRDTFETDAITTSRVRVRLMAFDGRYMQVADRELDRLRDAVVESSRVFWRPEVDAITKALHQATVGVLPKQFITLGALQTMARVAA